MKKFLLIFLISISGILFSQQTNAYYTSTNLNLRSEPNKNSEVIQLLDANKKLIVDSLGNEWTKVTTFDGKTGFVSTNYISKLSNESNSSNNFSTFFGDFNQTHLFIVLAILFIAYVVALVKSRNNTIVAISGWKDFALLCVPIIGLLIGMFMNNENQSDMENFKVGYFAVSGIALLSSFGLSIYSNRGNFLNIIISILAKMFVVGIVCVVLFLIFGRTSPKKDARYRDGTKGNMNLKFMAFLSFIALYAIGTLVKNDEEIKQIRNNLSLAS